MARIRGRGNRSTEVALAKLLRLHRITGWRRHASVPGKPDFIFRAHRLAIFVDGCFWHGCPRCYTRPKSNRKFWDAKFARNRARDRHVNLELRRRDWRVLRIWEHQLRKAEQVAKRVQSVLNDPVIRVSAVTQTDPPRVDTEGFKLTHPERAKSCQSAGVSGRCGFYGQPTHGARTRHNQLFDREGLGHSRNRSSAQAQPQHRSQARPGPASSWSGAGC